jgi:hypothetical protein
LALAAVDPAGTLRPQPLLPVAQAKFALSLGIGNEVRDSPLMTKCARM